MKYLTYCITTINAASIAFSLVDQCIYTYILIEYSLGVLLPLIPTALPTGVLIFHRRTRGRIYISRPAYIQLVPLPSALGLYFTRILAPMWTLFVLENRSSQVSWWIYKHHFIFFFFSWRYIQSQGFNIRHNNQYLFVGY